MYLVAMFAKAKLLDKIVTCYFVNIIKMFTANCPRERRKKRVKMIY